MLTIYAGHAITSPPAHLEGKKNILDGSPVRTYGLQNGQMNKLLWYDLKGRKLYYYNLKRSGPNFKPEDYMYMLPCGKTQLSASVVPMLFIS